MASQPELDDDRAADIKPPMSYSDYLHLEKILDAQEPLSEARDELLFIIQHQTSELWMKLAITEIRSARAAIAEVRLKKPRSARPISLSRVCGSASPPGSPRPLWRSLAMWTSPRSRSSGTGSSRPMTACSPGLRARPCISSE